MRLFVLDENGRVVFEYDEEDGRGYRLDASYEMQVKVLTTVTEALRFLLNLGRKP